MRNHELSRFIPQELLSTRPLNVQYRSAKHISEFCSKIVQINRKGKFSNPRVHGIFLSKNQLEVELRRFSKMQEIKSELDVESLEDLAKSLKLKESYKLDRWVVVICLKYEKIFWEKLFQKFDFDEKQVTFVLFEDGLSSCVFTGGEVHSVLLLIDGPKDDDYSKDTDKYNDMILLACSRAQYELVIYVNEKMNGVYENLSSCKEQTKNFVSKIQDSPTDQGTRNFLATVESKIPDNEDLKSLVKNCNLSFLPTNINMELKEDLLPVVFCEDCEKPLWSEAVHALFCPNFPHENNVHILTCNTDLLITENISPKPVKSILCFIDLSNNTLCGRDASLIKKVLSEVNNILLTEIVVFVSTEMTHSVKTLQQTLEIGQNVQVTVVPYWKAENFYKRSSDFSKSLTFSLYNLETKLEEIKPFLQGWINRQILLLLGLKQSSSIIKILLGSDSVKNPQNVLAGLIVIFSKQ